MTNPAELVMVPHAEYDAMKAYIAELESKLNWLTEQVRLSRVRRFGASSEAAGQEVLEQMSLLFNEAEFHADEAVKAEKTVVREHERKKRSGSVRDIVPKNITVEEVRHELPELKKIEMVCQSDGIYRLDHAITPVSKFLRITGEQKVHFW